jgi:hypothetical protein
MYTISGAVLTLFGCGSFWYLLPRKGQVHPFVQNSAVGSMITIWIMTLLTVGLAFLGVGFFG